MKYEIRIHSNNEESIFNKVDIETKERLKAKIRVLEDSPKKKRAGADIKKIRNANPEAYRLRIGDYRVIYSVENNTLGEAALISLEEYGEQNIAGVFLCEPKKTRSVRTQRKGFNTTNKTKVSACSKLKHLVESGAMEVNSKSLISEFKHFVAFGVSFAAKFLRCHRTMMAIDESTTIKNPDAKRSKHICSLGQYAKYKRILTGSPVTKSPLDLFSQCNFLHEDLLECTSYYSFRNRYAVMKNHNFGGSRVQLVHSYQRLDELADILKGFSYRVLKEDCLDLPDKIYVKRNVVQM